MSKVVIFGAGQTAEIVYHYLTNDSNDKVVAFTINKKLIKKKSFKGLPIVPFENIEEIYPPKEFKMFIAISYQNLNRLRASKYNQAKQKKYKLISYISSKSGIEGEIQTGDNCFILENQVIQPYSKIGNNVFIWGGVLVGHHSIIGDHSWLTSESSIGGNAVIGPYCFLGMNSTISHMVTVGSQSFIGANTLVTKNTKEKAVYIAKGTEPYPLNSDQFLKITKMK